MPLLRSGATSLEDADSQKFTTNLCKFYGIFLGVGYNKNIQNNFTFWRLIMENTNTEKELDRVTAFFEITKSGKIAVWESGGALTSQGDATVVANIDGSKKKPLFIRRHGWLACGQHALLPLKTGDYLVRALKGADLQIQVWQVTKLAIAEDKDGDRVPVVHGILRYEKELGEWDYEPPDFLSEAIDAAWEKAHTYHCRAPKYVLLDD